MTILRRFDWRLAISISTWLCAMFAGARLPAQYSPEHPRVQAMVDLAAKYLATVPVKQEYDGGSRVLVAYTLFKITADANQTNVKTGIATAFEIVQSFGNARNNGDSKIIYSCSVAALLLADVDQEKYRPQLEEILAFLLRSQKPHGGFGYPGRAVGDTSQTQYAMLAMWVMYKIGMDVPPQAVESCLRYLKATHDPSGAWGYEGVISNGPLVQQDSRVGKSLATAGAGAVLIAGDILGFYREMRRNDESDGIPEAFIRTDLLKKQRAERKNITISRADIDPTIELAQRYQNTHDFPGGYWYYYWRYSQERYESFLEVANSKQNKSPAWYNQGVEELARLQEGNGSWSQLKKADYYSDDICTCFAVLFLIRSTQKAIGKLNEGLLGGGYGLPDDVSSIRRVGDRIINDAEASVENLLAMMESNAGGNVEVGLLPENLQLSKDPKQRKEQVARISRLLVSNDYKSRQLAAKLLGRSEDLDQAPELIYALTDLDPAVPMIAEESLRLLSRKLTAGDLKYNPKFEQKQASQKFWKAWYLGLRPDYVFVDQ